MTTNVGKMTVKGLSNAVGELFLESDAAADPNDKWRIQVGAETGILAIGPYVAGLTNDYVNKLTIDAATGKVAAVDGFSGGMTSNLLQGENGENVVVNSTEGNLTLSTTTSGQLNLTSAAAIVGAATGNSSVTVTSGNLTMATATAGNVILDAVEDIDIDAKGGPLTIDGTSTISVGGDAVAQKISVGGEIATRTEVELNALLVDVNGGTNGVTIDGGGASNFTTSAGALTLTSAEAATWSTAAGKLTVSGASGIDIVGNNSEIDLNSGNDNDEVNANYLDLKNGGTSGGRLRLFEDSDNAGENNIQ